VDRSKAETPIEQPVRERLLGGLLLPQLRSLLKLGTVDVLIPLGALEQHGPHLPLATDTIIAEAVADVVSRRLPNLVVAPCLPVGCSDHHLSFPGTASISKEVASAYLVSVTRTLLSHGFQNAYLFSGHAGNIPAMKEAANSLAGETLGRVAAFVDWPGQRRAMHEWARAELGMSPERIGSHAGHFETSIMLYLRPELVDVAAAPEGFIGSSREASERMKRDGIEAVSAAGVIGDPRDASAAAGVGYLEVLVSSLVAFIEDHRSTTQRAG
jgi:creatinine amidohydrolase/Fe(II)-dependent formamide hydrolase-like protein